ncbi:hypothetical protein ACP4OV_014382 [Aristida adscensionis]
MPINFRRPPPPRRSIHPFQETSPARLPPPPLPFSSICGETGLDQAELMAAAAAATATRKRQPRDDGASAAPAGKKQRARVALGSIYDYERLEVVGEGSYGVVLRARDRRTGETVAAKWVRLRAGGDGDGASDLRDVFREACCLAACGDHPSVLGLRGVAADAATGDVFLVTEFVGPSLREAVTRPCSEAETRAAMRQLLRGAARIHAAGLVHRDVKPENVLVGAGGALKICDFGMAAPARPPGGEPHPEWWAGTRCYRSPEQLEGCRRYGQGVDVWALGCVMAKLLTGEVLFDEETEEDTLVKVFDLRDDIAEKGLQAFDELPAFQGVPKLSQAGRELLAGLLSVHPDERLTAAAALRHRWFAVEGETACVSKTEQRC